MEGGSTSPLGLIIGEFNEGHPKLNAQERNGLLKSTCTGHPFLILFSLIQEQIKG